MGFYFPSVWRKVEVFTKHSILLRKFDKQHPSRFKEFLDSGNLRIFHFSQESEQIVRPFLNKQKSPFPGTFINSCDELFKDLLIKYARPRSPGVSKPHSAA